MNRWLFAVVCSVLLLVSLVSVSNAFIPPPPPLPLVDVQVTVKQVKDLMIIRVKASDIDKASDVGKAPDVDNLWFASEPLTGFIKACKSKSKEWQVVTCTDVEAEFDRAGLDGKDIFLIKVSKDVDLIAWKARIWDSDVLIEADQGIAMVIRR